MSSALQTITPNLWFDGQAEQAALFYTSVFKNSSIDHITRYGEVRHPVEGITEGTVMTVQFTLDGQRFIALNGGPQFKFTEAISLVVKCRTQEEVDHYWDKLSEGGDEQAKVCGWLKDQFGVSWQVVPTVLYELIGGPDSEKAARVTAAMLQMQKLDISALLRAAEGAVE